MREQEIIAELEANNVSDRRRRALLSELREVATERSTDVLQANLQCADVKSRVRAVIALAQIGTDKAVDVLIDSLTMDTGPSFTFAIKALADFRAARAVPALIQTLDERRNELSDADKCLIMYALVQTPHRNEVPVLAATLRERRRSTRRAAAMALTQIRAPESRTALEEAVRSMSWLRGLPVRRALHSMRNAYGE